MLYLEAESRGKESTLLIPGGSITAGMAIFDTMLISSPIAVVVTWLRAWVLYLHTLWCNQRKRYLPYSRVLIHQPNPNWTMVAAAVDINIQAQEMEKLREELNGILAKTSGQPLKDSRILIEISTLMLRGYWYGYADKIVDKI